MILAVGYRVRSTRGTQFRQWATSRLRKIQRPPQISCGISGGKKLSKPLKTKPV